MNILAKSRADKLPKVRKSFEEMERLLEDSPIRIQYYYDFPNILMCYCEICKQTYPYDKRYLLSRKTCPVCTHKRVIAGYNDVATLRPELVKYFKNPEEAHLFFPYSNKSIVCICPKCKKEKTMALNNLSALGFGCLYCSKEPRCLVVGKNDIATKANWLVQYLTDKEDATKYAWTSSQKIWFSCPICKRKSKKNIFWVARNGFSCSYCSDNISYPNKYARAFFEQLPVESLEFEYKRSWTHNRSYDCYFEFKERKYFVEMDGGMHYGQGGYVGIEEARKIDCLKDKLAKDNNIEVIRIDCRKSDSIYISNNLKQSAIASLFDLSIIDWNKCDIMASKNFFTEMCNDYNANELSLIELANKYHVSYSTVKLYIRKGKSLGICNNTIHPQSRNNMIFKKNSSAIGIILDMDGNVLFDFVDFVDAAKKLNKVNPHINVNYKCLWWSATKSEKHIFKKQYQIILKKGK